MQRRITCVDVCMKQFKEIWYSGCDGSRLFARYYLNKNSDFTVMCLHGLTRNSADFETFAEHLSEEYSVLIPDQRGRGLSAWSDAKLYRSSVYVDDMWRLLEAVPIDKVTLVGSSMGGIVAMMMAEQKPEKILGVILNDIGPEVGRLGLRRMMSNIGKHFYADSWETAAKYAKVMNRHVFPDYSEDKWLSLAKKLYRLSNRGCLVLNYDPVVVSAIYQGKEHVLPARLWKLYGNLKKIPLLIIRGENSDILSQQCFLKMSEMHKHAVTVTVGGRGHAPMLDELHLEVLIRRFLSCVLTGIARIPA